MGGSITLADVAARSPTLTVSCTRCERAGRYNVNAVIANMDPVSAFPALLGSKTLAELVGQKHHTALDSNDPVFMVAAVLTELQDKAKEDLGKLITAAAAEMNASMTQAHTAAQARAERIIPEAGRWASEQIRSATQDGAEKIAVQLESLVARAEAAGKRTVLASWIATAAAVLALSSAAVVMWLA
jgi:hypothetical protein